MGRKSTEKTSTELRVLDAQGQDAGSRLVSSAVFCKAETPGLLHEMVRWQRASKRAGTHAVLTRAEASGGGTKPWKQKGTGRARSGSNTSPLWVGGGVAHGPKQRDYSFGMNRKQRKSALCQAISARNREGRLVVIDDFGLAGAKTKKALEVLRAVGVPKTAKALVVISKDDEVVAKSLRNVAGVKVLPTEGLNVYDVLNANFLLIAGAALSAVESRLTGNELRAE